MTLTDRRGMSRRGVLGAALVVAAAAPIVAAGPATAASGPVRLRLPAPTGPRRVGTVALHLEDRSRPDPFRSPGHSRELMIGVWYPAGDTARHPRAPWMPPAVLRRYLVDAGYEADVVATPFTSGHENAPVRRPGERRPVIVFSHGAHDHRGDCTVMVQELASHGYVVVTVDHIGDAYSQLPDGRIVVPSEEIGMGPIEFAVDLRFVLDSLDRLAAGHNPDVEQRRLPYGLGSILDVRRIGMFGFSKGASATARVMIADRRVEAGLSIDAPMEPAVAGTLDRPFMMMTAEFTRAAESAVARFWSQLAGWRLNVQAEGAIHTSYGDLQVLMPQLGRVIGLSDEELRDYIGTLDPARSVRIQQAYPLAFFDQHLRQRRQRLLEGPARAFGEVRYLP